MFSVYAPDLKNIMGYNQKQIQFIGASMNLGVYFGVIPGLFYDYFGGRWTSLMVKVYLLV